MRDPGLAARGTEASGLAAGAVITKPKIATFSTPAKPAAKGILQYRVMAPKAKGALSASAKAKTLGPFQMAAAAKAAAVGAKVPRLAS